MGSRLHRPDFGFHATCRQSFHLLLMNGIILQISIALACPHFADASFLMGSVKIFFLVNLRNNLTNATACRDLHGLAACGGERTEAANKGETNDHTRRVGCGVATVAVSVKLSNRRPRPSESIRVRTSQSVLRSIHREESPLGQANL